MMGICMITSFLYDKLFILLNTMIHQVRLFLSKLVIVTFLLIWCSLDSLAHVSNFLIQVKSSPLINTININIRNIEGVWSPTWRIRWSASRRASKYHWSNCAHVHVSNFLIQVKSSPLINTINIMRTRKRKNWKDEHYTIIKWCKELFRPLPLCLLNRGSSFRTNDFHMNSPTMTRASYAIGWSHYGLLLILYLCLQIKKLNASISLVLMMFGCLCCS